MRNFTLLNFKELLFKVALLTLILNMNKIIVGFLFYCCCCFSQNNEQHTLIDSTSKKVVPFATIKYLNVERGTYSDEKGTFYLEQNVSDSISISSIGYRAVKLVVSNLNDTIFMVPKVEQLKEITINSNIKEKDIGLHKKSSNFSWYIEPSNEFITSVNFNKNYRNAHITNIHFPIKKVLGVERKNLKAIVRTNIYSAHNETIKDIIFTSEPIYYDINSKGIISFDISDEIIEIDSDKLYFGIELIGFVNDDGAIQNDVNGYLRIPFTNKKTKGFNSVTYKRLVFSEKVEWKPLNDIIKKYVGLKKDYFLPIGFTLAIYED